MLHLALRDHTPVSWFSCFLSFFIQCLFFFRPPSITLTRNKVQDRLLHLFLNLLPAHAIDLVTRWRGERAVLVRRMSRLQEGLKVLEFFANRQWSWDNGNVARLSHELNSTGKCSNLQMMVQLNLTPKIQIKCNVNDRSLSYPTIRQL